MLVGGERGECGMLIWMGETGSKTAKAGWMGRGKKKNVAVGNVLTVRTGVNGMVMTWEQKGGAVVKVRNEIIGWNDGGWVTG